MSDETPPSPPGASPFKYHLELTPAQLKITHTALHSLLDDFGHEQSDVQGVIREVLDKLPDGHAMRAIRLDEELARELEGRTSTPPAVLEAAPEPEPEPEPDPGDGGGPPPPAVA